MKKAKKNILISAGPTIEPLDPVRYLTNYSTGKMGYALAKVCIKAGHNVMLVSGPTRLEKPENCHFFPVQTAKEMHDVMFKLFPKTDILFKVAAVADYRVKNVAKRKIKKTRNTLKLTLIKNPDILKELGKTKKPHQILVGFAAETHEGVPFAKKKIIEKHLDWIALNDVSGKAVGFASDENTIDMISRDGRKIHIPKQSKTVVAENILKIVETVPLSQDEKVVFKRFSPISLFKIFQWKKK